MNNEEIINPFEIPLGKKNITKQDYVKCSTKFLQDALIKSKIDYNDIRGMLLSIFVDWKKVDPQLKYDAWRKIVQKIGVNNYLHGKNNSFTLAHILAMAGPEIVMDSIYIKMIILMADMGMNPFITTMNPSSPYEQSLLNKNSVFSKYVTNDRYLQKVPKKQQCLTAKM